MTELLFKVLDEHGRPHHGGHGEWPMPENGKPGKWFKVTGELKPCRNGLHLCRPQDLLEWLSPTLWLAEAGRERIDGGNKIVVRRARLLSRVEAWDDSLARIFAADCAERALKREEAAGRKVDKRSWNAVRVARNYAAGKASEEDLDAARDAAWDAARDAAWDAAWDAARAVARAAAWDAARAAARAAAWDAARAAAWDAEREWQTSRLMRLLGFEWEPSK